MNSASEFSSGDEPTVLRLLKDAAALALSNRNNAVDPLFNNLQAKYDPKALNWIGSMNTEVSDAALCKMVGSPLCVSRRGMMPYSYGRLVGRQMRTN